MTFVQQNQMLSHLAQDSELVVVDWKKDITSHTCCLESGEWTKSSQVGQSPHIAQGPEPIVETEVQPNFRYVEYKRVLIVIPLKPTPVIVLLVFPSWFPRLVIVCLIVGILYCFL